MTACAFPQCPSLASSENPKSRREFCAAHAQTLCFLANTQPIKLCRNLVIPHSTFCLEHDHAVMLFNVIHSMEHQQMDAQRLANREARSIMGNLKHNGLSLR